MSSFDHLLGGSSSPRQAAVCFAGQSKDLNSEERSYHKGNVALSSKECLSEENPTTSKSHLLGGSSSRTKASMPRKLPPKLRTADEFTLRYGDLRMGPHGASMQLRTDGRMVLSNLSMFADVLSSAHPSDKSTMAQNALDVVASSRFERVMGQMILVHLVFIALETELPSPESPQAMKGNIDAFMQVVWGVNDIFTLVFAAESMLRLYAFRCRFFLGLWDVMDLIILLTGIWGELVQRGTTGDLLQFNAQMVIAKICRVCRLLRCLRIYIAFPEINVLFRGVLDCMGTVLRAVGCIIVAVLAGAIICVEYVGPEMTSLADKGVWDSSCTWCSTAFDGVLQASMTWFQLLLGEGWSLFARPLVLEKPWTILIFLVMCVFIPVCLVNLITATIVDATRRCRDHDQPTQTAHRHRHRKKSRLNCESWSIALDTGHDEQISKEELKQGLQQSQVMQTVLGLEDDDFEFLFNILEKDGVVRREEWVQAVYKMNTVEVVPSLFFLRRSMQHMVKRLDDQEQILKTMILESRDSSRIMTAPRASVRTLSSSDAALLRELRSRDLHSVHTSKISGNSEDTLDESALAALKDAANAALGAPSPSTWGEKQRGRPENAPLVPKLSLDKLDGDRPTDDVAVQEEVQIAACDEKGQQVEEAVLLPPVPEQESITAVMADQCTTESGWYFYGLKPPQNVVCPGAGEEVVKLRNRIVDHVVRQLTKNEESINRILVPTTDKRNDRGLKASRSTSKCSEQPSEKEVQKEEKDAHQVEDVVPSKSFSPRAKKAGSSLDFGHQGHHTATLQVQPPQGYFIQAFPAVSFGPMLGPPALSPASSSSLRVVGTCPSNPMSVMACPTVVASPRAGQSVRLTDAKNGDSAPPPDLMSEVSSTNWPQASSTNPGELQPAGTDPVVSETSSALVDAETMQKKEEAKEWAARKSSLGLSAVLALKQTLRRNTRGSSTGSAAAVSEGSGNSGDSGEGKGQGAAATSKEEQPPTKAQAVEAPEVADTAAQPQLGPSQPQAKRASLRQRSVERRGTGATPGSAKKAKKASKRGPPGGPEVNLSETGDESGTASGDGTGIGDSDAEASQVNADGKGPRRKTRKVSKTPAGKKKRGATEREGGDDSSCTEAVDT